MDLELLADQPEIYGDRVRLEPMGAQHVDGLLPLFGAGPASESRSPVDGQTPWERAAAHRAVAAAAARSDRADWAVVRIVDGAVIGEVVLFELDEEVEAMTFRIALVGPAVFGQGYGTEATLLVRDFAFGPLGLHRLQLEVLAENARARAVYDKAGFVVEGRRRQAQRVGGGYADVIDMALLATDPAVWAVSGAGEQDGAQGGQRAGQQGGRQRR